MSGILGGKSTSKEPSSGGGGGILGGKSSARTTSTTTTHKPTINGNLEMDDVMGTLDRSARLENEYTAKKQAAREIPVIGSVLKGFDKVGDVIESNPVSHFLLQTGRDIASTGGTSSLAGLSRGAQSLVGKTFPSLAGSTAGRIASTAASEAIVGAPLGVAQQQMADPSANTKDLALGGLYGGILGGGLGALGRGAAEGAKSIVSSQANKLVNNALTRTAENSRSSVISPFSEGTALNNPVAKGYTEEVSKTFKPKPNPLSELESTTRTESPLPVETTPIKTSVRTPETTIPPIETTPNERGFVTNLRASGKLTPEVQQGLEASPTRTYEPTTNAGDLAKAEANVQKGFSHAEDLISSPAEGKSFSSEQVLTGFRLIQELQKQGKEGVKRAVNVAERLSEQLTKAGQTVQAASVWNRLTPEGALIRLTRQAEKVGKKVDPSDAKSYMDLAESAQAAGASKERVNGLYDIADKLKKGEEVTDDEMAELIKFTDDVKSFTSKKKQPVEKLVKLPSDKKVREKLLANLNEKEKNLQEFIKANSNRVSSTPLDIWGAYTALGAIKLAKGTISFTKWAEEMIRDAGNGIKPHLNNIYDQARTQAEEFEKILPKPDKTLKVADAYVSGNKLSPKDAQTIYKLASDFGEMNRMDQQKTQMKMQEILNRYSKGSIQDKINALRFIAMLGNTTTQLTNIISSPIMYVERQLLDMVQTPFDMLRSRIKGQDRQITFKTGVGNKGAWDSFFTPFNDYKEGAKTGGEAGWKGIDPNGITSQDSVRGLAFKSKWNPAQWAERSLGAVMKGADYGAYNMAAQNKLRKLAYLDAINKKVPKENIPAHMDRYMNNIDENIVSLMDKVGKETTFQSQGKIVRNLMSAKRKTEPVSGAIVPFLKTPLNILIQGLERTPAGLLKGIYEIATMSKNPNITAAQISDTLTKAILGTAGLTGTGFVLGQLGILTGSSPSKSKDAQYLEEEVGQGKFKFNSTAFSRMMDALVSGNLDDIKQVSKYREGDKQVNYSRLQPLAFPASMGATLATQKQAGKPTGEAVGQALAAGGQSLFDMSFLKGLKDTFDVPNTDGNYVSNVLTRLGQSYAKSFSPSLLGQEARREDPFQRQVTNKGLTAPVTEYFKSRTPSLGGLIPEKYTSKSLPKRVTSTGIEKRNESGLVSNFVNPLQSSTPQFSESSKIIYDLIQRTGDESLAPSPFEKSVRGQDKSGKSTTMSLNPQQFIEAQKRVGDRITKEIEKLPKMNDEKLSKLIEDIYDNARKIEREKMKKEFGLKYDRTLANKK